MKRVYNFKVVEGDPNEIDKNEILLVRDQYTGNITNVMKRGKKNKLYDIITPIKSFNTEQYQLYVTDSRRVVKILPLSPCSNSYTNMQVDVTSLVKNFSGVYRTAFSFVIDEKDKYIIGDLIDSKSEYFVLRVHYNDDDLPGLKVSHSDNYRTIKYECDIDVDEGYEYFVEVARKENILGVTTNTPITHSGIIRFIVDTSSLN